MHTKMTEEVITTAKKELTVEKKAKINQCGMKCLLRISYNSTETNYEDVRGA